MGIGCVVERQRGTDRTSRDRPDRKIAAKNDDDAVRRLYRKYHMELFRFGFHVLHDQGLAEEMVQETFIKFCQQAPNYDADLGPVRGWLFTMARSTAYDVARRPSSRPLLPVGVSVRPVSPGTRDCVEPAQLPEPHCVRNAASEVLPASRHQGLGRGRGYAREVQAAGAYRPGTLIAAAKGKVPRW